MKLKALLLITLALYIAGCQPGETVENGKDIKPDYSTIAGTWKAENSVWQIVISEDGKVESALFPMGQVRVIPNKTVEIIMKDKSKSRFKSGDFPLYYDPEHGELNVTINVIDIQVKFLDNEITGNNESMFTGFISEDGKEWDATLIELFDYGPRFPQEEEDIDGVPIKFIKVEDQ